MTLSGTYHCENQTRRLALLRATGPGAPNGIDFLEVVDDAPGLPRQQILLVRLLRPLAAGQLRGENVAFAGGAVVRVSALWAYRASDLLAATDVGAVPGVAALELAPLQALLGSAAPVVSMPDTVLVVRTDPSGDFAPYRLGLVISRLNAGAPPGIDVQLRFVDFSFKAACPSELDCLPVTRAAVDSVASTPELDYLTKDYAGFRQFMIDRLAVLAPELITDNAADLPVMLVELLAHAADKLSYFQDAVATEAYLGTARRRRSIRRHARLLDYTIGEGSNARTFVRFEVGVPSVYIQKGMRLLTSSVSGAVGLDERELQVAAAAGSPVFETMEELEASGALNEIELYTWGDDHCCLPAGATQATLRNTGGVLSQLVGADSGAAGTLLAFLELRGSETGLPEDADPKHRHVVRLTRVTHGVDALFEESPGQPQRVVEIEWGVEDALPFSLRLWRVTPAGSATPLAVSVAAGNVVLADHGLTLTDPPLTVQEGVPFRPVLASGPLTWQGHVQSQRGGLVPFDSGASAASALLWDEVRPAIRVVDEGGNDWRVRRDLLESDALEQDFVVEVEDDGRVELRFGDGILGRLPQGTLTATYRVGNGLDGNVGADTIAHFVAPPLPPLPILKVSNPLVARGGSAPESIEQVRRNAPRAFRVPRRAVTDADYARAAERHPEVQRAHATRVFTGSWLTVFIDIDRLGGRPVDAAFKAELGAFLEPFRLSGHDFVIRDARFVPIVMTLTVCVSPGFLRTDVQRRLSEAFSAGALADGTRGFFHPDNFTFGQPLYLSQALTVARSVLGVAFVDTSGDLPFAFRRGDRPQGAPLDPSNRDFQVIRVAPFEVIRADGDVNRPQNGSATFVTLGGS